MLNSTSGSSAGQGPGSGAVPRGAPAGAAMHFKPSSSASEQISVDGQGCVWSGQPSTSSGGVPLGYRTLKSIYDVAAKMQAPIVVMPGWSIEHGLAIVAGGGTHTLGFCRPEAANRFSSEIAEFGKVGVGKIGLVRPLSTYQKGQVSYAIFYVGSPATGAGMFFPSSFLG